MINAVGLGIGLTAGQIYVSEITPLKIRGVLLSGYTFSLNLGFLISASIAFNRVTIMDSSAYKVLFAFEWVWPGLILAFVYFVPESPYHLIRNGNLDAAVDALKHLYSSKANIPSILSHMVNLVEEEKAIAHVNKETSYLECFKGTNWRRTRIILYCNGLAQMIGATFTANAPYFMIVAGMSPTNVAMMVELGIAFALASSLLTFWYMTFAGRRKMIIWGLVGAALLFLIMGIAGFFNNSSALWTVGISLQLVWWTTGPCIGPAISIAGEVSAIRLREKSQSIGFVFNYFYLTVWNVVVPYMFNVDEGNLGGKTGWIFFATAVISIFIVFFEFPETKDRSFEELDEIFLAKVPARRFKGYEVRRETTEKHGGA